MAAEPFRFDPALVAKYEVEGWKAYYDRNWLRLLGLIVSLNQAQFRIPFPHSLLASYYIVRASIAFVPKDHPVAPVRVYLEKFYVLARRYSGLSFNPKRAALFESDYWEIHRQLVGNPDKTAFVEAMTSLHAAVFDLSHEQARPSSELRVEANNVLDTITNHISTDPAGDWQRCEDLLTQCYTSISQLKQP